MQFINIFFNNSYLHLPFRQESLTTKDKTIGDIGEQLRRQESEYEKLEREHKRITAKLKEMTAEKDDWMKQ